MGTAAAPALASNQRNHPERYMANNVDQPETGAVELPHLAALGVTGKDAADFLQRLVTSDVDGLVPGQLQLSSLCDAKGRAIAVFLLSRSGDDDFLILLPESLGTVLRRRMEIYVLRSAVTISAMRGPVLGRQVPSDVPETPITAESLLALGQFPADPHRQYFVRRAPAASPDAVSRSTASEAARSHVTNTWRLLDVRAGLPLFEAGQTEAWVPQMLNLDLLDAISFHKGCYPGQEIVARMRYLGKLKRQLYRVAGHGIPAEQGAPVYLAENCAEVGRLLFTAPLPPGNSDGSSWEGLAVLAIAAAKEHLSLNPADPAATVERLPLPYESPGNQDAPNEA